MRQELDNTFIRVPHPTLKGKTAVITRPFEKEYTNRIRNMPRNTSSRGRNPRFTKSVGTKRKHYKKKKQLVIVSKKQVKKWNKAAVNAKIDLSVMRNHVRSITQSTSLINSSSLSQETTPFNVTQLINACDERKIRNVAATSANLIQDVTTETSAQSLAIKLSRSAHFFNNFAIPFWVDVYSCVPKVDQGGGPAATFVAGMTDMGLVDGTGPSATSIFAYPTQSQDFNKFWKIAKHKKVCLGPGESVSLHFKKSFKWSPSQTQAHSDGFQPSLGGHVFMVRLQGCYGHATTTTTQLGVGATSCDWYVDQLVECTYDANGAKYKTEQFIDSMNAATAVIVGWPNNAENTSGTNAL